MIGTASRNDYIGTGLVDTYSYNFKIFAATDLYVVTRDTDDVETVLSYPGDFSVTGVGAGEGGSIVLVDDLGDDYALMIRRVRPLTQETNVRNQGSFHRETIEDQFDDLVMIHQQQQNDIERSVRLPESLRLDDYDVILPMPEAGKAIGWDVLGTSLRNLSTTAIAFEGDDSDIIHLQAGSGATSRTVRSKLRERYSVKDFGAVGDGSADDAVPVQACVDACPNGGTVYIPNGIYKCTVAIDIGEKSIIIEGDGWWSQNNAVFGHAEWLVLSRTKGSVLFFPNATQGITHLTSSTVRRHVLRDLMLLGPGSGTSIGVQVGSTTVAATRLIYTNVHVANFYIGVEWKSINEGATYSLSVSGCHIGFNSAYQNNQCCHYQTEAQQCAIGIQAVGADTENFYGGLTQGCLTNGILIDNCNVFCVDGFHHENVDITDYDIKLTNSGGGGANGTISNHRISSNGFGGISITGSRHFIVSNRILSAGKLKLEGVSSNCYVLMNSVAAGTLEDAGNSGDNILVFNTALTTVYGSNSIRQELVNGGTGDLGQVFTEVHGISNVQTRSLNLRDEVTVLELTTGQKWTFTNAEVDANYYVLATCVNASAGCSAGGSRIRRITKETTGITINVEAAPGAGEYAVFDILLIR